SLCHRAPCSIFTSRMFRCPCWARVLSKHLRLAVAVPSSISSSSCSVSILASSGSQRHETGPYVRFGSKADIRSAPAHVRFTPKSGLCSAQAHVCFGPIADIGLTSDEYSDARQDHPDFGELARLRIDLD